MKTTVAVLVVVVVAAGTVYTQSPPDVIPPPDVPTTLPGAATKPPPTKEPTLDELLDQIERIREQKAELDRQEKLLAAEARKKIVKQTERLNKLGLGTPVPPMIDTTTAPNLIPPAPSPVLPGAGTPLLQPRN
jgi:hypothetical protein